MDISWREKIEASFTKLQDRITNAIEELDGNVFRESRSQFLLCPRKSPGAVRSKDPSRQRNRVLCDRHFTCISPSQPHGSRRSCEFSLSRKRRRGLVWWGHRSHTLLPL